MKPKPIILVAVFSILFATLSPAWVDNRIDGNGHQIYAIDSAYWLKDKHYATQDFFIDYTLSFLSEEYKDWADAKKMYFGSELSSNDVAVDSYEDVGCCAHVYFWNNDTVRADPAARRAKEEFNKAVKALENGKPLLASKYAGAMTKYMSNVGAWGIVMWDEEHHNDYLGYVRRLTLIYPSEQFDDLFAEYIEYDGPDIVDPYEATMEIAHDTFWGHPECSGKWMDENYGWENEEFIACNGKRFNLIFNKLADAIYSIDAAFNGDEEEQPSSPPEELPTTEPPEPQPPEPKPPEPKPPEPQLPEPKPTTDGEETDTVVITLQQEPEDITPLVFIIFLVFIALALYFLFDKMFGALETDKKKRDETDDEEHADMKLPLLVHVDETHEEAPKKKTKKKKGKKRKKKSSKKKK